MTDPNTELTNLPDGAEEGGGWDDLATLPTEDVRELFVTLSKALRAYQLYDENNPVYRRFVSALADAFRNLWTSLDRLTVHITEETILLNRVEVHRAESRSDSLAFLFYKDGIRELTFLPGIEDEEVTRFLSVLQRARKARPEGDDLLTILWEEDLRFLRYQYIDMMAEGVVLPEAGSGNSEGELKSVIQAELEDAEVGEEDEEGEASEPGSREGPKPVSREDFNPTLYSLDAREMEQLQREIETEMARNLRREVLSALFDRLEEPEHRERQSEILSILKQLLPSFLSRGALAPATSVLGHLRELEDRDGIFDDQRREEVRGILDRLSEADSIDELVRALEDGSIRTDPGELGAFLNHLRSGALGPLLRATEVTEVKELQPVIREAVQGIASRNQKALLRLLDSADPVVVAGAARLLGRMQVPEAGPALADLMGHESASVRLAAVEAARELRASTAAGALVGILTDPDRDVRIAAARALGQLRYRPATGHLEDMVTDKELRNADLTEKIAFFESYGLLAGDGAVKTLDKLLNGRGFLGRREPPEIRACAALGLGKVGTEEARAALREASSEEDAVVRSAVNRALRGEDDG